MSHSQNGHFSLKTASLKTALKATTVGGLAALMLSTGIAAPILHSFAAPVEVTAPQVPSFANVVDAVSPAVVSVRVQSNVQPASDDSSNFSFNFGGRGLDQLPDDHPLKRFFKEFGGPNQIAPTVARTATVTARVRCAPSLRAPASLFPKTVTSSPTTTSSMTAPPIRS